MSSAAGETVVTKLPRDAKRASGRHHFPQPREAIFDFFSNIDNEPKWNPKLVSVARRADGKWDAVYKGLGPAVVEVSMARPRWVRFYLESSKMDAELICRFEDARDGGTDFDVEMAVRLRGVMKLLVSPLMGPSMQNEVSTKGEVIQRAYESTYGKTNGTRA